MRKKIYPRLYIRNLKYFHSSQKSQLLFIGGVRGGGGRGAQVPSQRAPPEGGTYGGGGSFNTSACISLPQANVHSTLHCIAKRLRFKALSD